MTVGSLARIESSGQRRIHHIRDPRHAFGKDRAKVLTAAGSPGVLGGPSRVPRPLTETADELISRNRRHDIGRGHLLSSMPGTSRHGADFRPTDSAGTSRRWFPGDPQWLYAAPATAIPCRSLERRDARPRTDRLSGDPQRNCAVPAAVIRCGSRGTGAPLGNSLDHEGEETRVARSDLMRARSRWAAARTAGRSPRKATGATTSR